MSNPKYTLPLYWAHDASNDCGYELCHVSAEGILANPQVEVIDSLTFDTLKGSGKWNVTAPWTLHNKDREFCYNSVAQCQQDLEIIQAVFQNSGVDIKENYTDMQTAFNNITNRLHKVLATASSSVTQTIPDDFQG